MILEALLALLSEPQRKQVECLTQAIYHEARGEPERGQVAVAQVVLNRLKSGLFPETICEVVYEPKQFSHIRKATFDYSSEAWVKAQRIAVLTYKGLIDDPSNGAMYFCNPAKTKNCQKGKTVAVIANHHFIL